MKKIALALFTLLSLTCSGLVQATPLKWTLSGVTLSDSTIASGSFFYDAATSNYSNWSISLTAGTLPAFTYNTSSADLFSIVAPATEFLLISNGPDRFINFSFAASLTGAGGSVLIETTPNQEFDQSSWEATNSGTARYITGGSVIAATAGVPEPATLFLTAAALAGLVVSRRRTRSI